MHAMSDSSALSTADLLKSCTTLSIFHALNIDYHDSDHSVVQDPTTLAAREPASSDVVPENAMS